MIIFLYNLQIFVVYLLTVLYPKLSFNESVLQQLVCLTFCKQLWEIAIKTYCQKN